MFYLYANKHSDKNTIKYLHHVENDRSERKKEPQYVWKTIRFKYLFQEVLGKVDDHFLRYRNLNYPSTIDWHWERVGVVGGVYYTPVSSYPPTALCKHLTVAWVGYDRYCE